MSGSAQQSHIDWELTEEAFAKFPACLDPDPARAGEKYEALREAPAKILDRRGALSPDELVDEAFNRVTQKLKDGGTICGVPTYCNGGVRLVLPQSLERPSNNRNWLSVDGSVRLH